MRQGSIEVELDNGLIVNIDYHYYPFVPGTRSEPAEFEEVDVVSVWFTMQDERIELIKHLSDESIEGMQAHVITSLREDDTEEW